MADKKEISVDVSRVQKYSLNVSYGEQSDTRIKDLYALTHKFKATFAEYAFNTANFHSIFREAAKSGGEQEMKNALCNLNDYTESRLRSDLDSMIEDLCELLDDDDNNGPRVRACIKRPHLDNDTQEIIIRQYCRSREISYTSDCPINDNSGFSEAYRTGRSVKLDNLMESAFSAIDNNEAYQNPRILTDSTSPLCKEYQKIYKKRFSPMGDFLSKFSKSRTDDLIRAWLELWRAKRENGFVSKDCYASSCIFPITLADTHTSDEFKKLFFVDIEPNHVFAFLCIDHPEPFYFDPIAKNLVGVVADIVLSYFIRDYAYTFRSKEWREATEKFGII